MLRAVVSTGTWAVLTSVQFQIYMVQTKLKSQWKMAVVDQNLVVRDKALGLTDNCEKVSAVPVQDSCHAQSIYHIEDKLLYHFYLL